MKIIEEVFTAAEIRDRAWQGARSTLDLLTDEEIEMINKDILEENYPDGMTACAYNDFWWFDTDYIAEILGYEDFEELFTDRSKR